MRKPCRHTREYFQRRIWPFLSPSVTINKGKRLRSKKQRLQRSKEIGEKERIDYLPPSTSHGLSFLSLTLQGEIELSHFHGRRGRGNHLDRRGNTFPSPRPLFSAAFGPPFHQASPLTRTPSAGKRLSSKKHRLQHSKEIAVNSPPPPKLHTTRRSLHRERKNG